MTLDLAAVGAWMADHVPGVQGLVSARKFAGGQSNPTYLLETAAGRYVLRRKPAGPILKSAHAVEREFRVQAALAPTPVPVARMQALCTDPAVIGSAFYVMDHVPGRIFDDPRLPEVPKAERSRYINAMIDTLAAIHRVDPDRFGLGDYGPRGAYVRRQIDRWTAQYRASETGPIAAMDRLIPALDAACPAEDGRLSLVHGDYRLDNLVFAPERPEVAAVLDWELSTLGHPFADLAGVIMQWQMPPGAQGRGLAGVDRAAAGLPDDAAVFARYCAAMEIDAIPDFPVYLAFCFFRMAAILQGVKKRALDGTASNPARGLELGALVPRYAEAGLAALG